MAIEHSWDSMNGGGESSIILSPGTYELTNATATDGLTDALITEGPRPFTLSAKTLVKIVTRRGRSTLREIETNG
jgi:hypothetical protein